MANGLVPIAAVITAPVLASSLGVEGRGLLAAVTAPYLLASVAATFGIPEAITFFVSRSPSSAKQPAALGLRLLLVVGAGFSIGMFFAAPEIAGGNLEVAKLMKISSLALVPALLVTGLRAAANGLQQWNSVAAERAISAAVRLAPTIVLWAAGALTLETAFAVVLLAPAIGGLAYWKLWGALGGQRPAPGASAAVPLLAYGSRSWIGSLSGVLLSRLDQLLMIPLSSAAELGLYAVAVNISEITLIVNAALTTVMFAIDARDRNNERLHQAARVGFAIASASAIAISTTMIAWLPTLFGADFRPAMPAVALLLVAIVIGTPGSIAGAALAARGNPGLRSWALVVGTSANAVVLVLLVPSLGAVGAAIATVVGNGLAGWTAVVMLRVVHGVPIAGFLGIRGSDVVLVHSVLRRGLLRSRGA